MPSEQPALFSPRIDLAIRVASVGHALHVRKGTSLPYIAHPVSVARLLEQTADAHVAALKAADVAHNVRSILIDLDAWGPGVLGRFNAAPDRTLWYYDSVAKEVARRLEGHPTGLPTLLAAGIEELSRRIG